MKAKTLLVLILLLCLAPFLFSLDYPGPVLFWNSSLSPLVSITLQPGSEGFGTGMSAGFGISNLIFQKSRIALYAGYSLFRLNGESPVFTHLPWGGVRVGYELYRGKTIRFIPGVGAGIGMYLSPSGFHISPDITLDLKAEMRLAGASSFGAGFSFHILPVRETPSFFTISFGFSARHVYAVPVPRLDPFLAVGPLPFSPDDDGYNDVLSIRLKTGSKPKYVKNWSVSVLDPKGKEFYSAGGEGPPPATIDWDGRSSEGELVISASEYQVVFTARDILYRTMREESTVAIDILVERVGDRYRIRIPTIVFPPNSADLSLIEDPDVREGNRKIVRRLSELLGKFPDYTIHVEGHANNLSWQDPEQAAVEEQELLPLSTARAEAVRDMLITLGIDPHRLVPVGRGGASPIVPFGDEENRWKNRRVEFILIRE